jgi:hypothetical protein
MGYFRDYPELLDSDIPPDDIPDYWEARYSGSATGLEPDEDIEEDPDDPGTIIGDSYPLGCMDPTTCDVFMSNRLEYFLGTDPTEMNSDSDLQGLLDGQEVYAGTDPLDDQDPKP